MRCLLSWLKRSFDSTYLFANFWLWCRFFCWTGEVVPLATRKSQLPGPSIPFGRLSWPAGSCWTHNIKYIRIILCCMSRFCGCSFSASVQYPTTTPAVELPPAPISRATVIVSIRFKIRVKRTLCCARFGDGLRLEMKRFKQTYPIKQQGINVWIDTCTKDFDVYI